MLAVAGYGVVDNLKSGGALELARAELDSLPLPPATADTAGLGCNLIVESAWTAVLSGHPGDVAAPMTAAAELAERFAAGGDLDSLGFPLAPADVALHRMAIMLEAGEPDQAVSITEDVDPRSHPFPIGQAQGWRNYGKALTRLRGRRDDMEQIAPPDGEDATGGASLAAAGTSWPCGLFDRDELLTRALEGS